jgi:hypothetical protein
MSKLSTPLADRLAELGGVAPAELAAIIRRPVEQVESWIDGSAEPDGEARILLRVLDDSHTAALAVARIRGRQTRDLRGDGMLKSGIEAIPHPGGFTGTTGGPPQ